MNEPSEIASNYCPGCQTGVETGWMVCPHCGLRLKRGNDLVTRSFQWLAVLVVFATGQALVSWFDPNLAAAYGLLLGLPLAIAFSIAAVRRIQGVPLTWRQLRTTTLRAAAFTFVLLVVVPIVIGVALLLLAFAICAGAFQMGP